MCGSGCSVPPGWPGVVGSASRMSVRGRESLPDVQEWSGVLPGCAGVVVLSLPDVQEWSGVPPGYPGVVGSASWMSVSGREALPDVGEWLRGPPEFTGVVGRPSGFCGSGREALTDV